MKLQINYDFNYSILQNVQSIGASSQDYLNEIITDDTKELITSVRRRLQVINETIKPGSLNVLSAKYEVKFDYLVTLLV